MALRKVKEAVKDITMTKRKTTTKRTTSKTLTNDTLQDSIRLAAYYNYLYRITHNTPGDQLSDWLEAEKYILKNTGRKKTTS